MVTGVVGRLRLLYLHSNLLHQIVIVIFMDSCCMFVAIFLKVLWIKLVYLLTSIIFLASLNLYSHQHYQNAGINQFCCLIGVVQRRVFVLVQLEVTVHLSRPVDKFS